MFPLPKSKKGNYQRINYQTGQLTQVTLQCQGSYNLSLLWQYNTKIVLG